MNIIARTAVAGLVASVIPVIPFLVISALNGGERGSLFTALAAWAFSASHIVVLGVPVFALLLHKQIANRLSLTAVGFLLGFLPAAVVSIPNTLRGGSFGFGPLVFAVLGAFSAWVFWLVWRKLEA